MQMDISFTFGAMSAPAACASLWPSLCKLLSAPRDFALLASGDSLNLPLLWLSK